MENTLEWYIVMGGALVFAILIEVITRLLAKLKK